jgi:hypothetical protein
MRHKRCLSCGHVHLCKNRRTPIKGKRPERRSFKRDGHEYLETAREMTLRRMEIYRNAGGEVRWFDEADPNSIEDLKPAQCQGCVEPHLVGWAEAEWHHNSRSKGGRRCDCAACGMFVCKPWHLRFHNRIIKFIHVDGELKRGPKFRDSSICFQCGKPYWWHLQKAAARLDDGHIFNTPSGVLKSEIYPKKRREGSR